MNPNNALRQQVPSVIEAPQNQTTLSNVASTISTLEGGGHAFASGTAILEGATNANFVLNLVKTVCFWAARGLMLPWELIFRREIGERYFSKPVVMVAFAVWGLFWAVNAIHGIVAVALILATQLGLVIHGRGRGAAYRAGVYIHSYSEGRSILERPHIQAALDSRFGPINTLNASGLILEPFLPLLLGLITYPYDYNFDSLESAHFANTRLCLALYFFAVVVSMVVYRIYCATSLRGQVLDRLDAELIVEMQRMAASGQVSTGNNLQFARGVAFMASGNPNSLKFAKEDAAKLIPKPVSAPSEPAPAPKAETPQASDAAPIHSSENPPSESRVQQPGNVADRAVFMAALDAAMPATKAAATPPSTPVIVQALNPKPAIDEEEFTFRNANSTADTQREPATQSNAVPAPQPVQVPAAAVEAPAITASVSETQVEAPAIEPPAAPPPDRRKRRPRLKQQFTQFDEQPPVSAPEVSANQPAGGAWEPDLAGWGQSHPAANRELINLGGEVPERQPAQPTEGVFLTRKNRSRGRLHR